MLTRGQKTGISAFIIAWTLLFHYESLRFNYLDPLLGRRLPKVKFLFPPSGWIMFAYVEETDSWAEVLGLNGPSAQVIDPHLIFETRWIGYDNIRRNVLVTTLDAANAPNFCRYLGRKFPEYEGFAVMQVLAPAIIREPSRRERALAYTCSPREKATAP